MVKYGMFALSCGLAVAALSCRSADGPFDSRFVAVHNALTSMGLVQTGPMAEGSLDEEGQMRVAVELHAHSCHTFVALGSARVRDLKLRVEDEGGAEVARDGTHGRQSALQFCPQLAGRYDVVLNMVEGHGEYVLAHWAGGGSSSGDSSVGVPSATGPGTCAQPLEVVLGQSIAGDTRQGASVTQGSCASGSAPEQVYQLVAEERIHLNARVQSSFDASVYVLRECGQSASALVCNDDAGNTSTSEVEVTLEPGTYFIVVDGYGTASGEYELIVNWSAVPSVAQICDGAPVLSVGEPTTGTTEGRPDHFQASCAGGARGSDAVYRVDINERSRLRVRQQSDHDGVLYLRSSCVDATAELMCNDDFADTHHSLVTAIVDPGQYYVVADGFGNGGRASSGGFTLMADVSSVEGGGAENDTCEDVSTIAVGDIVQVDTLAAADTFHGTCGGQGSPDIVRKVRVTARSRLQVRTGRSEFAGAIYLRRECDNAATEVACTLVPKASAQATPGTLDATVAPGTYYIVVDGTRADTFGAVDLEVRVDNLAALNRMCRRAPVLRPGQTTSGSTQGQRDDFHASCAGGAHSGDRVYRLRVTRRSSVTITMQSDFDGVLHLRGDCGDAASEIACNDDHEGSRQSRIQTMLDPGTYYLIVDGFRSSSQGGYTLDVQVNRL